MHSKLYGMALSLKARNGDLKMKKTVKNVKNNDVMVNGNQKFMGVEIPVLTGGFSNSDAKCVLARDIARVHGMETRRVNEDIKLLINKNRIKEGVHYIDLKSIDTIDPLFDNEFVRKSKNIYLLSERGYASLIKYMDDDKSWEVHDRFVEEYFELKKIVQKVSENYALRMENLNRLFTRVYPQEYENVANEIVSYHEMLGKKQRLDERHRKYDKTEYKQFTRDKIVDALTELQKDVTNKDIVAISLYAKDLIIKLQNDYRLTNNKSDGQTIGHLKNTYAKNMTNMGQFMVDMGRYLGEQDAIKHPVLLY